MSACAQIVLFDQRGSGKSTPIASVEENTTWDLVDDIERLRKHLKIEEYVVLHFVWSVSNALQDGSCSAGPGSCIGSHIVIFVLTA